MRKVSLGREPIKKTSSKSVADPAHRLARELLHTAKELRFELAEMRGFIGDLEQQARRVSKLPAARVGR
jgi:hypothetical protein